MIIWEICVIRVITAKRYVSLFHKFLCFSPPAVRMGIPPYLERGFHDLKRGETLTYTIGQTLTYGKGVTQTDFEGVARGVRTGR